MNEQIGVGVFGLGLIGAAWARHWNDDGLLRGAWNRSKKTAFPQWKDSPAEVADAADVLVVVVADPPAVQSVIDAILPRLTSRHLVIQCSTIDPKNSTHFASLVRSRGAAYVESPFTGSKPAAEQRKTIFLMGGETSQIARAETVLSRVSQHRFVVGTIEQACVMKLCGNLQIASQIEALCEALAWARAAGITDETFFTILRPSAAWSGLYDLKMAKLRSGDFAPQFSVKHMLKDMKLADGAANSPVPLARVMIERLTLAAQNGCAEEDMIALLKNLC